MRGALRRARRRTDGARARAWTTGPHQEMLEAFKDAEGCVDAGVHGGLAVAGGSAATSVGMLLCRRDDCWLMRIEVRRRRSLLFDLVFLFTWG